MNEWVISFLQFILTRHLEFNFLKKKINIYLIKRYLIFLQYTRTEVSKSKAPAPAGF